MFANRDGLIKVNMDFQQIHGEALRKLLDYCFSNSDTISLSQSHNIGMTKAEADEATAVYYEYLKKNEMWEGISPTEEEMIEVFKDMADTEEELAELIRKEKESRKKYEANFRKTQEEVTSYLKDVFGEFKLLDREVTCMTPCTYGGPHVMYYLAIEDNIKKQFFLMRELFSPVIADENKELRLDDPTFYKEGNIVLLICSHEKYATLFLEKEQYDEFNMLNVPHKLTWNLQLSDDI